MRSGSSRICAPGQARSPARNSCAGPIGELARKFGMMLTVPSAGAVTCSEPSARSASAMSPLILAIFRSRAPRSAFADARLARSRASASTSRCSASPSDELRPLDVHAGRDGRIGEVELGALDVVAAPWSPRSGPVPRSAWPARAPGPVPPAPAEARTAGPAASAGASPRRTWRRRRLSSPAIRSSPARGSAVRPPGTAR